MDLLANCQQCYPFCLAQFPPSITIKAGLTPATTYILKVTDQLNNRYSVSAMTDSEGDFEFNIPDSWPEAWFCRDSGTFKFELSLQAEPWEPVNLTFGTKIYTCIAVIFAQDDTGINVIQ